MKTKVVMCWSGGKDSAAALWRLQQDARYEVVGLLTTLTVRYNRVSMHGVRRLLLQAQAEALGLPLYEVWLPTNPSNAKYEAVMGRAVEALKAKGVGAVAFGDLFLQDIREYRERMMARTGLEVLFPIWGEHTGNLARSLIAEGFHATLVCVDTRRMGREFLGRPFDAEFLEALPKGIDPCGENGEFHTFVHDGPNFRNPIPATLGVRLERDGLAYADLLPQAAKPLARRDVPPGG